MYWHRIAYSVLMVPLRIYSLTHSPILLLSFNRRSSAVTKSGFVFCVFILCCYIYMFVFFVCLFYFFSTQPRDWLGRMSPKWPILCRVGRKTLTQSINWRWWTEWWCWWHWRWGRRWRRCGGDCPGRLRDCAGQDGQSAPGISDVPWNAFQYVRLMMSSLVRGGSRTLESGRISES